MNVQTIEQFLKLREELREELISVDEQIVATTILLAQLKDYQEQLQKTLHGEVATATKTKVETSSDTAEDQLYAFLKVHPGSSRAQIREGVHLDDDTVKNLMGRMSKRGRIVNQGNKRYSEWFITETEQ